MDHHSILRVVSKLLIPPIIVYALYVQWHGDYGPGGGFQAGVIFAVAFILYGLVFGVEAMTDVLPTSVIRVAMSLGVLIYAGTGFYSVLAGHNFLDYEAIGHGGHHAQEWGILLVELGVGITVASVMVGIFVAFASRAPKLKDEDW